MSLLSISGADAQKGEEVSTRTVGHDRQRVPGAGRGERGLPTRSPGCAVVVGREPRPQSIDARRTAGFRRRGRCVPVTKRTLEKKFGCEPQGAKSLKRQLLLLLFETRRRDLSFSPTLFRPISNYTERHLII